VLTAYGAGKLKFVHGLVAENISHLPTDGNAHFSNFHAQKWDFPVYKLGPRARPKLTLPVDPPP
jgi:hypothetical protein